MAARTKMKNCPCVSLRVLSAQEFESLWPDEAFFRHLGSTTIMFSLYLLIVDLDCYLPKEEFAGGNGTQMP